MADTAQRLRDVIEPYVAAEGVELDDLEILGKGSRIVRVTLDTPGGVDVDRIADLSRGISRLLDEVDPTDGAYTLEVSSPGLERKLRVPRHFEKSIGRQVKVKTVREIDGTHRHDGVITAVDDRGFTLDVAGDDRSIPFDTVQTARTVFVWEKAIKPGSRR